MEQEGSGLLFARRIGTLVGLVLGGAPVDGRELASRAAYSMSQFHRKFRQLTGETPGEFQRRLLLERAAWRLRHTSEPVTDLAFDSGYGSLEAFTRAFSRAFGISPSHYRRLDTIAFRLPAPSDIHYRPATGQGEYSVDLFDRLIQHDAWLVRRMLERATTLSDEQLDRPIVATENQLPWDTDFRTLRQMLHRLVITREIWLAAFNNVPWNMDEGGRASPAELLDRHNAADEEFSAYMRSIRDRDRWDEEFVDSTCEPAESFTFGSAAAHVLTFQAHRRTVALYTFRQLGVHDLGSGDPIEWERMQAAG
ncbi:MAG TPA: helix-turn-helix domain-containing protein [Tepidiformaceae bacterium]|nr:helix-turn-helix domain-containing protein [Tepidiformaceae bacterium]